MNAACNHLSTQIYLLPVDFFCAENTDVGTTFLSATIVFCGGVIRETEASGTVPCSTGRQKCIEGC